MGASNLMDVSENMKRYNIEMNIDPKQLRNEDVDMITCTPVIAGRKLGPQNVPESPFLSPLLGGGPTAATPMVNNMRVVGAGVSPLNIGGVMFNKPVVQPSTNSTTPQKSTSPYDVAQIP